MESRGILHMQSSQGRSFGDATTIGCINRHWHFQGASGILWNGIWFYNQFLLDWSGMWTAKVWFIASLTNGQLLRNVHTLGTASWRVISSSVCFAPHCLQSVSARRDMHLLIWDRRTDGAPLVSFWLRDWGIYRDSSSRFWVPTWTFYEIYVDWSEGILSYC